MFPCSRTAGESPQRSEYVLCTKSFRIRDSPNRTVTVNTPRDSRNQSRIDAQESLSSYEALVSELHAA
jgi:hypothetical protein